MALEWLLGAPVEVSTPVPTAGQWYSPIAYSGNLGYAYGHETVREALELAKGLPPEGNIMPYIQILLDAKRLGLTVTR